MILVNLVGPPASGKSTLASKFVLEHPEYWYVSIDSCRLGKKNDKEAWEDLRLRAVGNRFTIIESSGLSWRLSENILIGNARILTVLLIASRKTLQLRLKERQHKRPIPFKLARDEAESIDWCLQNLHLIKYPIDKIINTDQISRDESYQLFKDSILDFQLENTK